MKSTALNRPLLLVSTCSLLKSEVETSDLSIRHNKSSIRRGGCQEHARDPHCVRTEFSTLDGLSHGTLPLEWAAAIKSASNRQRCNGGLPESRSRFRGLVQPCLDRQAWFPRHAPLGSPILTTNRGRRDRWPNRCTRCRLTTNSRRSPESCGRNRTCGGSAIQQTLTEVAKRAFTALKPVKKRQSGYIDTWTPR